AGEYASVEARGHRENYDIESVEFKSWLDERFFAKYGTTATERDMQDALRTMRGRARFQGLEHAVYIRIASLEDSIYIDLGGPNWDALEIKADGWRVVPQPPVKFRRTKNTAALPYPMPGGKIDDLRPFVNIASEDDWVLLVAWLLAALRG